MGGLRVYGSRAQGFGFGLGFRVRGLRVSVSGLKLHGVQDLRGLGFLGVAVVVDRLGFRVLRLWGLGSWAFSVWV